MFGQIFSSIGGAVGGMFGGGIFSTIGRFAGRMFGNYLERLDYEPEEYHSFKNIRDSFHLSTAVYGDPISLIFGSAKVNSKIIWADQIKEVEQTKTEKKYFSDSSQTKALYHTTECEYYLSFALAICEGEIAEISRVWANNELINLGEYKFRLYHGSEEQMPDPLIATSHGGQAPGFRGLAYIVFEDLPLVDFDNIIPSFSFEVIRKANIPSIFSVEDLVKSMVMIPGSGEFVYDTIIQHKIITNTYGATIAKKTINSHNYHNIPNSLHSLNQLKLTCANIEWVAPVVCWFGDSLDTDNCTIKPAVEYNDPATKYSEEWSVGGYTRFTAKLISRDQDDNPRYGGSVNDASVVRYLQELQARSLKIMFYPMFFVDIERKPWRGHVTGSPLSITEFFNKEQGYNNFILHYARLVKDYVNAFVIGSELIGLTSVKAEDNSFPAVIELIKLARLVKEIVGPSVQVTYAADWSEYHHTNGGWYNLDPLWSSPYIDFVGIDAYFPVTSSTSSAIFLDEIIKGWKLGEGYDYFIDGNSVRQPLSPEYAWKNLKYWWENPHYNPDGSKTEWFPRMKKFWFTEFGFPSIDKATNQPNVFFDPFCSDGGVPRYSSGEIDFSIQRKAIRAFIEYWQEEEYIEHMFLWTWDARPYPAWPHMNIWRDGYLWEKGHWVNNKFGACSLASILLELSHKSGINLEQIDVSGLDESVEGIMIRRVISVFDVINTLRISYFFDIIASQRNIIKFVKRGQNIPQRISSKMLVKLSDNSYFEQSEISKVDIVSRIELNFIDHCNEYKNGYCQVDNENFSNQSSVILRLPIVMSSLEASRLAQLILKNARIENKVIRFIIPVNVLRYEPGDFINISYLNYHYQIRIIYAKLSGLTWEVTGVIDDFESYYLPTIKNKQELTLEETGDIKFFIIDLPFIFEGESDYPYLAVYLQSSRKQSLYASISGNNSGSYSKIANLKAGASIGNVISVDNNQHLNIFVIDELSKFVVACENLETAISIDWNLALCGKEVIRFRKCQKLTDNLYQISSLIRGEFATESFIHYHQERENFILLESRKNLIPVSAKLEQKLLYFRISNLDVYQLVFENNSQKLVAPFIDYCRQSDYLIKIRWRVRQRVIDDWVRPQVPEQYEFLINITCDNRSYNFIADTQNFNVNFGELGLSGEININIISKDKKGRLSPPAKIAVRI